jgi:hypothetical protein
MKKQYIKPVIFVEELTKQDVLLASMTNSPEKHVVNDGVTQIELP